MSSIDVVEVLKTLLNNSPDFGELSLRVIIHDRQIVRVERGVMEKIATETTKNEQ